MIGTGLAIGLGALGAGSIISGIAGQNAANDRMNFASNAVSPTADELTNLSQANQLALQNVGYQRQSLQLLSDQYQKLLQGQSTAFLQPLDKQLNIASQNNMNRLYSQLGQGADSSAAGIRAQAMFGQSAAETRSNAQMQALQLFGNQQQQVLNSAFGGLQTANGMQNQIDQRQLQAAGFQGASNYGGLAFGGALQSLGGTLFGKALGQQGPVNGVQAPAGGDMTAFNNFLNTPSGSSNYGMGSGAFGKYN